MPSRVVSKSGKFLYIHEEGIPNQWSSPPRFAYDFEVVIDAGVPYEVPVVEEVVHVKRTGTMGEIVTQPVSVIHSADEFIAWALDNYGERGLVALAGREPTLQEIEQSRAATYAFYTREVEKFNKTVERGILLDPPPVLQFWANKLGLRLASAVQPIERFECPACLRSVPRGALVCPSCGTRLYPDDVFERLLRERQARILKRVGGESVSLESEEPEAGEIDEEKPVAESLAALEVKLDELLSEFSRSEAHSG